MVVGSIYPPSTFFVMKLRLFLIAVLYAASASAQYPSRPIRLYVPIPPGGAPDIAARILADKLSPALGQPVAVANKVGSNGRIATEAVARAGIKIQ